METNTANTPPPAVMMSIAAIALRDHVAKPTVSIKVKQLIERHQLTVERDGRGRVAKVNVAQYDHLRARFDDPIRAQAPPLDAPPAASVAPTKNESESLNEATRQKAWIEAERSRLSLAEHKKELIRAVAVAESISESGIEIARIIDRLPMAADEIAAAVGRDGTHGVRVFLKTLAQKMRADIADALTAVAGAAPETETDVSHD